MYITYNKENKRVAYLGEKKPISYSDNLEVAEVESVPEKYDYLTVEHIQEKSRVIKEEYTEKVPILNEETGEEETTIIKHPKITEIYITCELIPKFYEYTEEQLEAQKYKQYKSLTEQYIRQKYSQGDMEALLNNYLDEDSTEEDKKEFNEMQNYRKECKTKAHKEVYGE